MMVNREGANQKPDAYYDAAERVSRDSPEEARRLLRKVEQMFGITPPAVQWGGIRVEASPQLPPQPIDANLIRAYARIGDTQQAIQRATTMEPADELYVLCGVVHRFAETKDRPGLDRVAERICALYTAHNRTVWAKLRFSPVWPLDDLYDAQVKLGQTEAAARTLLRMEPNGPLPSGPAEFKRWKDVYTTIVCLAERASRPDAADAFSQNALDAMGDLPEQANVFRQTLGEARESSKMLPKAQLVMAMSKASALPNAGARENAFWVLIHQTNDPTVKMQIIQAAADTGLVGAMIDEAAPSLTSAARTAGETTLTDLWVWSHSLPQPRERAMAAMAIGEALMTLGQPAHQNTP